VDERASGSWAKLDAVGWRDRLEGLLRERRTRLARAELERFAEELEAEVDRARGLSLPGTTPTWARVEIDGAAVVLRVRAAVDPHELLRLPAPLTAVGESVRDDPRIATLLRDAESVQLTLTHDNDTLALSGPAEPLDAERLRVAAVLAGKLASRLPIVASDVLGSGRVYVPPGLDAWLALARAWGLEVGDSTRDLAGIHRGLGVALRGTDRAWGAASTRIRVDAPTETLSLFASHPTDAGVDCGMPLRGGFGALFVRIGDDEVSLRAAGSGTLPPLAERVGHPFELRWDPDGLTLDVAGLLVGALRPTAEQVLSVATALADPQRGAPYR